MPGREPLPDGVTLDDMRAAVQAAWLAESYKFVGELIEKYLDATPPHHVCFRCAQSFRALGLYEFRARRGTVRLCDECWRATDCGIRPEDGPAITVGASIRDRYGAVGEMWVQCEARGDAE